MKMNFLKYEVSAGPDDIIEVTLSNAANVRLLDSDLALPSVVFAGI